MCSTWEPRLNAQQPINLSQLGGDVLPLSTCEIQSGTGSTASTNATNCKNAAGDLYAWWFINTSATIGYVRLYNLSSTPTCTSATGFVRTIPIPPAASAGQAGGVVYGVTLPRNFSAGIAYCITGGGGNADGTNAPAGIFGELNYK